MNLGAISGRQSSPFSPSAPPHRCQVSLRDLPSPESLPHPAERPLERHPEQSSALINMIGFLMPRPRHARRHSPYYFTQQNSESLQFLYGYLLIELNFKNIYIESVDWISHLAVVAINQPTASHLNGTQRIQQLESADDKCARNIIEQPA